MATCYVCHRPKATLACGICKEDLCKYCTQFVEEGHFSFYSYLPPELSHTTYCNPCYDAKVEPKQEQYDAMIAEAKNINVYLKDQGKESRTFSRLEPAVTVERCADREETLLRLAFQAVERGFNGLVDVDIVAEKVRDGAYQTQVFNASAIPTDISEKKRWT